MNKLDILIVEDELFQREMLRDFLRKAGHLATEAESGEKALQLLEKGCFDLMLMDFRMPGMNGLETLRRVKIMDTEIDVVIMTAYGTVETAVAAMKAGAWDYITKPMDLDELAMLIRRIAEHRTLVRENEILRQELRYGRCPDHQRHPSGPGSQGQGRNVSGGSLLPDPRGRVENPAAQRTPRGYSRFDDALHPAFWRSKPQKNCWRES